MKKATFIINEKLLEWLRAESYKTRKSQSELVREAIRKLKKNESKKN